MKPCRKIIILATYLAIVAIPHLLGGGWWPWPLPIINK
ncbi:hypothetical protein SSUR61_0374 [Streptococcus suis R61]|uniref:Uncharacterized protein n=1 Tax=Streptococcus suis R61 TaxID=996306 RepID=A0AA87FA35_STRSU|nr:hypothetical protein SSUR61_0374 [Streptococcus suis R61]